MKRTLYKIACSCDLESFESTIQRLLEEGWSLQGGVARTKVVWAQAMTKGEEIVPSCVHGIPMNSPCAECHPSSPTIGNPRHG